MSVTTSVAAVSPPGRWSRAWWAAVTPRPTKRLAWASMLGAVPVLALPSPSGLLTAAAVLVLALLVDAVRAPGPWLLGVERALPRVVVLGDAAEIRWEVRNPTGRPLSVALADEVPPSLGVADRRPTLRVPASGAAVAGSALVPRRRGTFRPPGVTVRVAGPWGLATRQHRRALPGHVEVHPAFPSRRATEARLGRDRLLQVGRHAALGLAGGGDFDHLREYRTGDDVRRVEWRASQRVGHPVVKVLRPERDREVLVLLEHGRRSAELVDGVPRLDHAMDAAMAVVTAAQRVGDRAGLVAYAARVTATVAPARRADQLTRVSRALHALQPELLEADHRDAIAYLLARHRRRALLVMLTDVAEPGVAEDLLGVVPLVVARHEVVVGDVVDPLVARLADGAVGDLTDAHRAAAAAGMLASRDAARRRLRGVGTTVVEAPPDALAGRLVDVYLELKARRRV